MMPVVCSFTPASAFRSSTVTRMPARASAVAQASPAKLAPTTAQSIAAGPVLTCSRRGPEVEHHPGSDRHEHEPGVHQWVDGRLRWADHHGDDHVYDRRAAEDDRHHVDRKAAGSKCPDDAGGADGAERSRDRGVDQARGIEVREPALRTESEYGHDHADQEIRRTDTEQRLQRIAKLRLAERQHSTV